MVELNMQFFVVIYAVITDNKPFSELGGITLKITDNDEKKVSQLSSSGHNWSQNIAASSETSCLVKSLEPESGCL